MKKPVFSEASCEPGGTHPQEFKVVCNRGEEVITASNLPIQWHLSEGMCAQEPTHVVVCMWKMDTLRDCLSGYAPDDPELPWRYRTFLANTYICKRRVFSVLDAQRFISFAAPGDFLVKVLLVRESEYASREWFAERRGEFKYPIHPGVKQQPRKGGAIIAGHQFRITIPDTLFVRRPETRIQRLWWDWVNRWHDREPVDQCAFRKRAIIALTVQPIFVIPKLLIAGICLVFRGLFMATLRPAYDLFMGYWPAKYWHNVQVGFGLSEESFDFRPYEYRELAKRQYHDKYKGEPPKLWVTPVELATPVVLLLIIRMIYGYLERPDNSTNLVGQLVFGFIFVICAIVLLVCIGLYWSRITDYFPSLKPAEEKPQPVKVVQPAFDPAYRRKLAEHCMMVGVNKPEEVQGRTVVARIASLFDRTKSKLCLPYES